MTDFTKRLGYGGSATVDGVQVLITSGGMEESDTPSYLEMLNVNPASSPMASRSRVLHADGTSSYTGSLSFDVTQNAMANFTTSKLFGRGYKFSIGINDGGDGTDQGWMMDNCFLTNLTLAGSPAGFVTASLSYMAPSIRTTKTVTNAYILNDYTSSTVNQPLGYWWSGGTDVKDWTLTMNQNVSPVYGNQNVKTPKYLKVGLIDYQLDVVLYNAGTPSAIIIRTNTFTLTGVTTATGYNFNGVTDLGMYHHTFVSAATYSSDGTIIVIT